MPQVNINSTDSPLDRALKIVTEAWEKSKDRPDHERIEAIAYMVATIFRDMGETLKKGESGFLIIGNQDGSSVIKMQGTQLDLIALVAHSLEKPAVREVVGMAMAYHASKNGNAFTVNLDRHD